MAYAAPQPYPEYPPRSFDIHPHPLSHTPHLSLPAVSQYPPPPSAAGAAPQPYYPHPHHNHNHNQHHHNPSSPAPMVYSNPEQQNINTLFVSGLPDDVKAREIHNLFRRRMGFDSCQLKYTGRGNQVVAFATFFNHQSAMAAMATLNGAAFDPQTGAALHIELARSNSRKRTRGNGAYAIIDKRAKVTNDDHETRSNDGDSGSDEPSGTENDNSCKKGDLAALKSDKTAGKKENAQAASVLNDQSGDLPPCSTLFIANLGPTCTEEELKKVFSEYLGFQTLKLRGKGVMPVAFADFMDVESSTAVMNALQGTLLGSSDRGGMHLEYARSKMRKS